MALATTVKTLLSNVASTSGNTLYGNTEQAISYFKRTSSVTTIQWSSTANSVGNINIQCSLEHSPTSGDWVTLLSQELVANSSTNTGSNVIVGNWITIRASANTTAGTINTITATY